MAQIKKRTDARYPLGGRSKPVPAKKEKPQKTGHKLRNTLLALTGAGVLGLGAHALLSDSNDTPVMAPQTPAAAKTVKAPAVKNGFPAFNPNPMQMDSEILKAYTDLRGRAIDPRMETEKFGDNPLFLGIREDMYNRMKANLQSGQFKTVNDALQDALNKQFSTFKAAITNRQLRESDMKVALPFAKTPVGFNMVDVANQIMTFKMAEQNMQWVHSTILTPQMTDNTLVFLGRAQSALAIAAANHLSGYTPDQAAKVMDLFGTRALDVDLLANAQNAQYKETTTEPGMVGKAIDYVLTPDLDAHGRYVKTLELTKKEIERGRAPFDALVFATNAYKTDSTSAAQDNKTDSFVYRFAAASDVMAGKSGKELIKALDNAIDNPNIVRRQGKSGPFPWGFTFTALAVAAGVGGLTWVSRYAKEAEAAQIKPQSMHENKIVRNFRNRQNGLG